MNLKIIKYTIAIIMIVAIVIGTYGYVHSRNSENSTSGPSAGKITSEKSPNVNDEVVRVQRKDETIYGHLYSPKKTTKKQLPVAIVSHGLGGNYQELAGYARYLAHNGYLTYALDFPGGSSGGRSTGLEQNSMSIFTEEKDLVAVIQAITKRSNAQKGKVLLVGGSQGAVVSALAASQHPEMVSALALMYPAFSITHDAQQLYTSMKAVPVTSDVFGFTVGRNYYQGLLNMDITKSATKFNGPVLIVHGSNDDIVPIKYAREAARNFSYAHLYELKGAGHGFEGSNQKQAYKLLGNFTNQLK